MSAAHTSAALAARLHRLTKDLPGFECCDAEASTTVFPSRTAHKAILFVKVKGFLRRAGGGLHETMEDAVDTAFQEMAVILATYRKPALKAAPNHQSKAA